MPGGFVLVVGPSGAGKDTLLRLARDALGGDARFHFPRRLITRAPSAHEDNVAVTEEAFSVGAASGAFALHWRAHGLGYAIPGETLEAARAGRVVVCNVSRRIVGEARRTLPHVGVVAITASPEVLAQRLAARARPEDGNLRSRLDRVAPLEAECMIWNDRAPEIGAAKLTTYLREQAASVPPRHEVHTLSSCRSMSEPDMALKERLRGLKSLAGPFAPFEAGAAPDDPRGLFEAWLSDAIDRGIPEAHAMTLSTVDEQGYPDARVLILKNVDADGWHFASTKLSPKGRQIAARPRAALTFYWQPLGRQVRLRGPVIEMGRDICEADFLARPIGSRAGALLARQSDVLVSDAALDAGLAEQRRRIEADPSTVSPTWAVYVVKPDEVEFWQADEERRHTRLRYRQENQGGWTRERLWP